MFKSLISTATIAVASLAASAASALTVATFSVGGDFILSEDPNLLLLDGKYNGEIVTPVDSSMEMDYIFSAALTIDDEIIFAGDLPATLALDDIPGIISDFIDDLPGPIVATVGPVLLGGLGAILDDPGGDLAPVEILTDVFFDAVGTATLTDTEVSGNFQAYLGELATVPDVVAVALRGSYSLDLAISKDVAPIPLPATAPALIAALGVFGLVRRKRATS